MEITDLVLLALQLFGAASSSNKNKYIKNQKTKNKKKTFDAMSKIGVTLFLI